MDEQLAYEDWCDDIARACKAAGVPEPDDYAMRWYRGETVNEVVAAMRLAAADRRAA